MLYTSPLLKDNEHFYKAYHLTFDEKSIVEFAQNGSSIKQSNGTGGQKGGLFFWVDQEGVRFWLKRFLACEKQVMESGIGSAKKVPEKVYVLEFKIPKKDFYYPDWQVDFALCGRYLIPLISRYYYKLYKKQLLDEKEVSLYLNCPLVHDKKYSKKIKGMRIENKKLVLNFDQSIFSFSSLKNYSSYYSGVIQRLHGFLYLKSKGYAIAYTNFMKKMFCKNTLGAVKYCGPKNLKPLAVEVWDAKTGALLLRSENIKVFAEEIASQKEFKLTDHFQRVKN
ncbi:MAG: hypothetical protein J6V53_03720 [Alphaproteobacteria bacterium]|nr:hypothetical protein [Alphaproteobacteria bacterium]